MIEYYKTENDTLVSTTDPGDGCWINVVAPDKAEIALLKEKYKVESEYILSSLDEEESSHIEKEDGNTCLIFDGPVLDHDPGETSIAYSTMPIGVLVTPTNVITMSHRSNPVLEDIAEGKVKSIHTEYKTRFVLQILYRMTTRFMLYLRQIDRVSGNLEGKMLRSMSNAQLGQMLDLKKSLVYFQTSLKSNQTIVTKLIRGRYLKMYEDDQDLLDDVAIELNQATEMSNIYASIVSSSMEALSSLISNNLNIAMKVLTAITILLAIPNMIFSFYGMNIGDGTTALPFSGNMVFVSCLTAGATLIVFLVLHRKDMF